MISFGGEYECQGLWTLGWHHMSSTKTWIVLQQSLPLRLQKCFVDSNTSTTLPSAKWGVDNEWICIFLWTIPLSPALHSAQGGESSIRGATRSKMLRAKHTRRDSVVHVHVRCDASSSLWCATWPLARVWAGRVMEREHTRSEFWVSDALIKPHQPSSGTLTATLDPDGGLNGTARRRENKFSECVSGPVAPTR